MTAEQLVKEVGELLVGQWVMTQKMGDWPGGVAQVTKVYPKNDPLNRIVCSVKMEGQGEMGIFDHETLYLVQEPTPLGSPNIKLRGLIEKAINSVSAENGSNTPDFILAEYLTNCLVAFDKATNAREKWYGRKVHAINVDGEPPIMWVDSGGAAK